MSVVMKRRLTGVPQGVRIATEAFEAGKFYYRSTLILDSSEFRRITDMYPF